MTMKIGPNRRLYCLAAFFAFWFMAIAVRLVWLQLVDYGEYTGRAARQQQRSIEVSAVRGNIYDRNGNDLAMTVKVDSIFAVPSEISDIHGTALLLGRIVKADPTEIENRMRASHAFAWVARKVDNSVSSRVRALNLKGIYFQKESKRFYPKHELAAQVLGYVGMDDEGLGGVEREYESHLAGKPGKMLISMDARRRWFGRVEKSPDPGENLVLTLDEKIQYIAERELERAMQETHAEAGTVIVENPHTGEILALANRPSFDPNFLKKAKPNSLRDRAVSDVYEPGSTFKLVTVAAALEEKVARPDDVVDCQGGSIVLSGLRIHDHKAFGDLTVRQILEHSSDVGAIKLALRLGDERFDRYIRAFGFGSQTGIELPAETRGLAKPVSRWSKVSIGAISMGQEIGVSPVQLISMVASIANDGLYIPPRIVAGTTPPRSTPQLIAFHPALGRRVISPLTAARMKSMMEGVVLRGTGRKAILDGYSSAGKTGTAQKIDPATGRYSHHRHVASFTGFAPVNNPAITVLVVLDAPATYPLDEGGQVAAPVFARVAQQVLAYLNVPHDVELDDSHRRQLMARNAKEDLNEAAPDHIDDEAEAVQNFALSAGQQNTAATRNSGDAAMTPKNQTAALPVQAVIPVPVAASASPSRLTPSSSTVVVDTADGIAVPDFHGKPLRTVLEEAESAGIELEVSGTGVAQDQSPAAGARIPPGGHVAVTFGR
ncbi:MAG TPA: penicillin-binding protein [Candidatus Angelobacter sp.]|nr:penicillin-binding protein [Candidatus Angelobacter sp.]